ncbi:LacI family DNA-binding transcriptional regulator [Terrarubrum flagellatum]|uniref:LacI family DNA-binding transcriptional regulator n=1 Tax=Terrirubrum flagellatum TaxID=2895980 RepID=UPI003145424C
MTLQDVAHAAGVSKATAARVMGGYGISSPAAREKVLSIAQELGYQPNELARSMTTGRSRTIGVVVSDIENSFFAHAVRGVSEAARDAGFNVILANSGEDVEKERDAVRVLVGKRVDGLIVAPASTTATQHLEEVHKSGRPLVLMDRAIPDLKVDAVTADDRAAAAAATRMLIEAGHTQIAFVSAKNSDDPIYRGMHQLIVASVRDRIDGFLQTSRDAGIQEADRFIRFASARQGATGPVVAELLSSPERPTAILASDNVVALEVFKTIRSLALRIPNDVSLVAFHDADWTEVTDPPITVIRQPVFELGAESAKALVERIDGVAHTPKRLVLKTKLIERKSVAPPPKSTRVL